MFVQGQKVKCLVNPYAPFVDRPQPGEIGTIVNGGEDVVSVRFAHTPLFQCWLTRDAFGNATIAELPRLNLARD